MTKLLYHLGIQLYGWALQLAGAFHPKAKKWVRGRKGWKVSLQEKLPQKSRWIWVHCASLGEFEQARNLIEYVKSHQPETGILLSFFSPSGYEIRKNYAHADYVCYLPLDTAKNARTFIELLKPDLVFFVKYELWINYLNELERQNIPTVLLSARVREKSSFFTSPLAALYKRVFRSFYMIFTQDEISKDLIQEFSGTDKIKVSSDTRYDRVLANKEAFQEIPEIQQFKKDRICIIAGSSWPKGEELLMEAFEELSKEQDICMILAPHEIRDSRISAWELKYKDISTRFSQISHLNDKHRILWIDNIGMLSRLYHYGDIAYVGGGWGTGLHNILEAATFGCPVLIGPVHDKFPEAGEMIAAGGCFEIKDIHTMKSHLKRLLESAELRASINRINKDFIAERSGATEMVISWMKENRFIV
ncbi:MAG: glycosyltransferase N-terminal domain-containing protein [Bacteroidota bacterium]